MCISQKWPAMATMATQATLVTCPLHTSTSNCASTAVALLRTTQLHSQALLSTSTPTKICLLGQVPNSMNNYQA